MPIDKIKGRLGFGCMRMQMKDDEVDKAEFCRMIDTFLENGFNYFDTAYGYIDGKSEPAIKECLTQRHDRESFVLTDKLTYWCFEKEEDILPLFHKQLERCGVDYFDFYLFHCLNREGYAKHTECHSFDIVKKLKEEGKIKHIGMSFHDSADFLDKILTEQPYMEIVQLQFNYLDYDDPTAQSKACYDVAVKHGKKVFVMEPVKGGVLANLPEKAADELKALGNDSQASYALRFVAGYLEVEMVLSGMGNVSMVEENMKILKNPAPFSDEELKVFDRVREKYRQVRQISCTKCNYCADVCPSKIPISEVFAAFNKLLGAEISRGQAKKELEVYRDKLTACTECGKCENNCPQSISIREKLKKARKIAG